MVPYNKQIIEIKHSDASSTKINIFEPNNLTEESGVFIIFPALAVMSYYYDNLCKVLTNNKQIAISTDLRGNHHSSLRPSRNVNFGYSDCVHIEQYSIIKTIKKRYPERKIYLIGHSIGGHLSALYSTQNKIPVDGLFLIASGTVYHKCWTGSRRYQILAGTQFANLVVRILGYLPGKKLGFGGLEAKDLIIDWSNQARTGNYYLKNDSYNYEEGMKKSTVPIYAISFKYDNLAPKPAVEYLLNKFKSAPKQHIHVESEQYNHFNWAKMPDEVVQIILKLLKDK